MLIFKKKYLESEICCTAQSMGDDWNISIFGGEKPHIGAIALGIARPSLSNSEIVSSSASLITVLGHKEDMIVLKYAKFISSKINASVAVCCGIHFDNITINEINDINDIIDLLVKQLIDEICNTSK